jgi:hypothetical protein
MTTIDKEKIKSQLFKEEIKINVLFNLFDLIIQDKNDEYYILTLDAYKRGIMFNHINDFFETCEKYYHNTKKVYFNKKISYKSFITIVRQICKYNNISIVSKQIFNYSNYELAYYISKNITSKI